MGKKFQYLWQENNESNSCTAAEWTQVCVCWLYLALKKKNKDIVRLQHAEHKNFPFCSTGISSGEKSDGFIPVFPVCGCLTREGQAGNFRGCWGNSSPEWGGDVPCVKVSISDWCVPWADLQKPWSSQEMHISSIFVLHDSFACWLFFLLEISSWKVLVVGFFLVNRILWYLWLKVKSVHSGWNTSSLEENGVGTSHGWGCVALNHRAMWISLLPVWGLELLDRTMYRLRALHSSEAASYVISNTFNAHQQGGTACFHFFVFANLLCGMFP